MADVREWSVAGALLFDAAGRLLLVQNLRRGGALDWTTPGGVIEAADGETVLAGLAREVQEETGLTVTDWAEQAYDVEVHAPDLGWRLQVEVHRAAAWTGDLRVGDDPDGIVVDARFVHPSECAEHVAGAHPWVGEPLAAFLAASLAVGTDGVAAPPAAVATTWAYRLEGAEPGRGAITRLRPAPQRGSDG